MTMPVESNGAVSRSGLSETRSYVDWPAIIAGAVLASAISVVLLTFGSAIGLSFASPFDNTGWSAAGLAIALAIWLVWVQVSSFMAGGYIAGRMRRRIHNASEHESDVRDGIHGLLVWGAGVIIGTVIVSMSVGGVIGAGASVAGGAAKSAVGALGSAADNSNPLKYIVDTAFRSKNSPAADRGDARTEAISIVGRDLLKGDVPQDDRTYLAQVISQQTGISPDEAKTRVDAMVKQAQAAASEAKQVAQRAKRFTVIAAFIAAASLAVSAAGALWAAGMGGRHRDEETVIPTWFDRHR